ncbi:MAG: septum formation protein Maf [Bacteroidaceae bacterium]|nr:septum formation protein Maf [Bacteroidaceae bacterium]
MNYKIILASNSPRRRELLAGLDIPFEVRVLPSVDESYPASLRAGEIPLFISREKANAYRDMIAPDELIITADTIVWLEDAILEKPHDDAEAVAMLHRLSGKTHEVFTGVTLTTRNHQKSFVAESKVTFATLSDAEIDYYVAHYHPLDKAGAYGVQEWIGYVGVERIEGSFYNVMGLPVRRLYEALASFPVPE